MLAFISFFFSNFKLFAIVGAVIAGLAIVGVVVHNIKQGAIAAEQAKELAAEVAAAKKQAEEAQIIGELDSKAAANAEKKTAALQAALDEINAQLKNGGTVCIPADVVKKLRAL